MLLISALLTVVAVIAFVPLRDALRYA